MAETDRSWIFEVVAVSGELLFGNLPLVVEKATGSVTPCREASREFGTDLGLFDRIRRRWHRHYLY
jgi:hypothetical protein